MPLEYGHDRAKLLEKAKEKRQAQQLAYPSGRSHVMLPTGQHVNPAKRHESKKARLRRRRQEAKQPPITPISFPLINQPPPTNAATDPVKPA